MEEFPLPVTSTTFSILNKDKELEQGPHYPCYGEKRKKKKTSFQENTLPRWPCPLALVNISYARNKFLKIIKLKIKPNFKARGHD